MCATCVKRRTALALGIAALATPAPMPAWALDTTEPRFRRPPPTEGRRRVALTLDACNGGFDRRIADALVTHQARATIFLTADWIRANKQALAFLLANRDLFTFENHGERHIPAILGPPGLSSGTIYGLPIAGTIEAIRREVEQGARAIHAATGTTTRWYRGATARYSPAAIPEIRRLGYAIAAYSLNADEGASLPAATVATRVAAARDGDVVIGHINQPTRPSGEGIARAIATLARAGTTWSTLDDLHPEAARAN